MTEENSFQDDYDNLITRCGIYKKMNVEEKSSSKVSRKKSNRNNIFLQCKKHSIEFSNIPLLLIETFPQNHGIDKNILMLLSTQKRMNLFP